MDFIDYSKFYVGAYGWRKINRRKKGIDLFMRFEDVDCFIFWCDGFELVWGYNYSHVLENTDILIFPIFFDKKASNLFNFAARFGAGNCHLISTLSSPLATSMFIRKPQALKNLLQNGTKFFQSQIQNLNHAVFFKRMAFNVNSSRDLFISN